MKYSLDETGSGSWYTSQLYSFDKTGRLSCCTRASGDGYFLRTHGSTTLMGLPLVESANVLPKIKNENEIKDSTKGYKNKIDRSNILSVVEN